MYALNLKKLIFIWAGLGFLILLSNCKNKQSKADEVDQIANKQTNETQKSIEETKMTLLCFGNSLTAGLGLNEEEAWPSLLQKRLDSLHLDYRVVNAGLSGETSSGGLNRIDWVLRQRPDIFILELGANDMLRGLDVQSTSENLNGILEKLLSKYPDCKIIIAGMMSPPNMGKTYEQAFNNIFPQLSKEFNAELIPFFLEGVAGVEELNLPDGKHPNAEGQRIVLENVWNSLKNLLKQAS